MPKRSLKDMRLEKLAQEAAGLLPTENYTEVALKEIAAIATRSNIAEFRLRASQYLIDHQEKFFQAGSELVDAVLELPRDEQYAELMRAMGDGLISKSDMDFLLKTLGLRHNEKIADLEAENRALRLALKLGKDPKEIELSRNLPDPSGGDPSGQAMIDVEPEPVPMPAAQSQLGKVVQIKPKSPQPAA